MLALVGHTCARVSVCVPIAHRSTAGGITSCGTRASDQEQDQTARESERRRPVRRTRRQWISGACAARRGRRAPAFFLLRCKMRVRTRPRLPSESSVCASYLFLGAGCAALGPDVVILAPDVVIWAPDVLFWAYDVLFWARLNRPCACRTRRLRPGTRSPASQREGGRVHAPRSAGCEGRIRSCSARTVVSSAER